MESVEITNSRYGIPSVLAERVWKWAGYDPMAETDLAIRRRGTWRFPWRTMQVGEHFFVPLEWRKSIKQLQNSVSSCVGSIQRQTDRRFHQRRYYNGIRVWRVSGKAKGASA